MLTDFIKFVVFSVNYNRDICVFPHFSLLYINAGGFICEKIKKTNAARILDDLKIQYELKTYPVDEEHLNAVHVAKEVGMPPEQVFKTLCVRGDKTGVLFAVIPETGNWT